MTTNKPVTRCSVDCCRAQASLADAVVPQLRALEPQRLRSVLVGSTAAAVAAAGTCADGDAGRSTFATSNSQRREAASPVVWLSGLAWFLLPADDSRGGLVGQPAHVPARSLVAGWFPDRPAVRAFTRPIHENANGGFAAPDFCGVGTG